MGRSGQLLAAVAGAATLVALACGSGGDTRILESSRGYSEPLPAVAIPLPGAYQVPPDRALLPLVITANAPAYAEAASALRARVESATAAASGAGCELRALDYEPPGPQPRVGMRARAKLVLDVPMVGLVTVIERMDRLDACIAAALTAEGIPEADRWLGEMVLAIDDPASHFGALAERFLADQTAAVGLSGAQVHAEDRRCVPSGRVIEGKGMLAGIELSLDLDCRVERGAAKGS